MSDSILDHFPLTALELDRLKDDIQRERQHRRNQNTLDTVQANLTAGDLVAVACPDCRGAGVHPNYNDEPGIVVCDICDSGTLLMIAAIAKHRWAELSILPGVYSG